MRAKRECEKKRKKKKKKNTETEKKKKRKECAPPLTFRSERERERQRKFFPCRPRRAVPCVLRVFRPSTRRGGPGNLPRVQQKNGAERCKNKRGGMREFPAEFK